MSVSLRDLEEIGSAQIGVGLDILPQTIGGQTNLWFTRRYKVRADQVTNYIFQILNPAVRVTDATFVNAYLVRQRVEQQDDANGVLVCTFMQLPTPWREDYVFQAVQMPGVEKGSLFAPGDFPFRDSAVSLKTQVRTEHQYFLGPPSGIPVFSVFQPTDFEGSVTSVLSDWTTPSTDEWVAGVAARQEICVDSIPVQLMGDIWSLDTRWAIMR